MESIVLSDIDIFNTFIDFVCKLNFERMMQISSIEFNAYIIVSQDTKTLVFSFQKVFTNKLDFCKLEVERSVLEG